MDAGSIGSNVLFLPLSNTSSHVYTVRPALEAAYFTSSATGSKETIYYNPLSLLLVPEESSILFLVIFGTKSPEHKTVINSV